MMEQLLFYFFAFVAVASACMVIFLRKPTRALLSLVVTMFALAVLYLLLGAPFVAMAHLIVYAGAVLVLFLFVIMLQGIGAEEIPLWSRFHKGYLVLAAFTAVAFCGVIAILATGSHFPLPKGVNGNIEQIGEALFKANLLPFELTSLLLLLGVFAAVSLAKKDEA